MRWKRLTEQEKRCRRVEWAQQQANAAKAKADARTDRAMVWTRYFAWRPYHDSSTGMVFFLEHVWCRARNDNRYTKSFRYRADQSPIDVVIRYPSNWEYRGGKDCPEIKEAPPLPECAPSGLPPWIPHTPGTVTCTKCGHTYRQRSLAEDQT